MSRRKRKKGVGSEAASRRPLRWLAAAPVFLAAALYLNTLGHGFVFDDGALILQNPQVTQFRLGEMFSAGGYRPVRTLTYALNFALGGDSPFGYHLLNVLLHAANVLLLFRLMVLWTNNPLAAAAGAALFAAHPAQTAAVAYVSGRKDLLATCFLLAGLQIYTRYRRSGGRWILASSMALFALAVFSKEVAVVFPLLLLLAEALILREGETRFAASLLQGLKRRPAVWAAAALVAGGGTWYVLFVSRATRMTGYWGGSAAANLGTSLKLFAHYLKLAFWPQPLIADYKGEVFPLSPGLWDLTTILAGILLAAFLAAAAWAASRFPLLGMGMFWFLACLLPVLQIVPFHEIAADHFLYLPLAGWAMGAAFLYIRWELPSWRRPLAAGLIAVLAVFSALTISRNQVWRDARTLWESTYEAAPGSYRANANLGRIYFEDSARREQALQLTRRAVELAPEDPVARSNLGVMQYLTAQSALGRGDLSEAQNLISQAVRHLTDALAANRRDGSILSNLGNCYKLLAVLSEQKVDLAGARENREIAGRYFETALRVDPREEVKAAWFNFALLYLDQKDYAKAAHCFEEFLKIRPAHGPANYQLGWCRMKLGEEEKALPHLRTAVQVQPSLEAFDLLATAYQRLHRPAEAIAAYQNALRVLPDKSPVHYRLGVILHQAGEESQAVAHLQAAAAGADSEVAARAREWLKVIQGSGSSQ